jgi:hypothetical protein
MRLNCASLVNRRNDIVPIEIFHGNGVKVNTDTSAH